MVNKYFYFGTCPIERDPSRVELFDPVGYHFPVQMGRMKLTLPAVTRSASVNLGRMYIDLLTHAVPLNMKRSARVNDSVESIIKSLKLLKY